jgi:hypothetical protein
MTCLSQLNLRCLDFEEDNKPIIKSPSTERLSVEGKPNNSLQPQSIKSAPRSVSSERLLQPDSKPIHRSPSSEKLLQPDSKPIHRSPSSEKLLQPDSKPIHRSPSSEKLLTIENKQIKRTLSSEKIAIIETVPIVRSPSSEKLLSAPQPVQTRGRSLSSERLLLPDGRPGERLSPLSPRASMNEEQVSEEKQPQKKEDTQKVEEKEEVVKITEGIEEIKIEITINDKETTEASGSEEKKETVYYSDDSSSSGEADYSDEEKLRDEGIYSCFTLPLSHTFKTDEPHNWRASYALPQRYHGQFFQVSKVCWRAFKPSFAYSLLLT